MWALWGKVWSLGAKVQDPIMRVQEPSLNPKSMVNNSPKPIIIAIKAMVLYRFGV